MAHHKRKRPRTAPVNAPEQMSITPSWWNIMFHSRPRRREDQRTAHSIVMGADPDEVVWAHSKRPHRYYW